VSPSLFFVCAPLLIIALGIYLQIYLGQLHHLMRRLTFSSAPRAPVDPDLIFPWIGTASAVDGALRPNIRRLWQSLNWGLAPATIAICWLRLLPFRGTSPDWLLGARFVPATYLLLLLVVAAVGAGAWSSLRRTIDRSVSSLATLLAANKKQLLTEAEISSAVAPFAATLDRALVRGSLMAVLVSAAISVGYEPMCSLAIERGVHLSICAVDLAHINSAAHSDSQQAPLQAAAAHLRGADLQYAQLANADFQGAWLEYANLAHAHMTHAQFTPWSRPWDRRKTDGYYYWLDRILESDLGIQSVYDRIIEANVTASEDRWAKWNHYCHSGTLTVGYLKKRPTERRANFLDARMTDAEASQANFTGAEMWGANGSGIQADKALFRYADIYHATLISAVLTSASLRGVCAEGAVFYGADLRGSDWLAACSTGSNFDHARLQFSRLAHGHFEGATFDGTVLDGADLRGTHFEGAVFKGTSLRGVDLRDAHVEGAVFQGVDFGGADIRNWHAGTFALPADSSEWPAQHVTMIDTVGERAGKPTEFFLIGSDLPVCSDRDAVVFRTTQDRDLCAKVRQQSIDSAERTKDRAVIEAAQLTWLEWLSSDVPGRPHQ
jgi:uncharacterized protein YjbI with pentapeptide repeats